MAHDVFVCHPSEDKATADAVVATLEAAKVRCWIAPRDVLPSEEWASAIVRAIASSELLVLVFSDHTNRSGHVTREIEQAVQHGIPIIPFRIEDVPPAPALEYFIGGTHWLDAMTPPLEQHLETLTDTARVLLDRSKKRTAPGERGVAGETAFGASAPSHGTIEWAPATATPAEPVTAVTVADKEEPTPAEVVPAPEPAVTTPERRTVPPHWWWIGGGVAAVVLLVVGVLALVGDGRSPQVLGTVVTTAPEATATTVAEPANGDAEGGVPGLPDTSTTRVTTTTLAATPTTPRSTTVATTTVPPTTPVTTATTTTKAPTTTAAPTTTRATTTAAPTTTTTAGPALVARDDSYTRTDRRQVCLDVTANDSGSSITVVAVSGSQYGSAKPSSCGITYTPPDGIAYPDSYLETLSYTVQDASGATATATARVTVN